jgi:hypothetical protein
MRTVAVKNDRALPQPPGLHLNARKHEVFLNDEIVPVIFSERNRDEISRGYKIAHNAQFGNIPDALRIAFHTRFHDAILTNACATGTSWCRICWSGRRESNPRCLLGRQKHYHYATPAKNWWAGLDSNQRTALAGQIYSLLPLTTRPPTQGARLTRVRCARVRVLYRSRKAFNPFFRVLSDPAHEARPRQPL